MKQGFWYLYICFLLCLAMPGNSRAQGLLFDAEQKPIKERASYQVFREGEAPSFTDGFSISFELSIRDFDNFGYVFLLNNERSQASYSFTYTYLNKEQSELKFNTDGKQTHFTADFDNRSLRHTWIPVRFDFDLAHNRLAISINGRRGEVENLNMGSPFKPDFHFGRHNHILDIPSFAIRNLSVEGRREKYFFPLNESDGTDVHDVSGKRIGHAEHVRWIINDAYHWKLIGKARSSSPGGAAYHAQRQEIWMYNQDSLRVYSLNTGENTQSPYATKLPVTLQLGTHFMNGSDGRLYVYELNNLPLGSTTVAALNAERQWEAIGTAALPVQLHHHVGFWDEADGKYYIFGGFGNQRYNNAFLAYMPEADRWDTLHVEGNISPRYFSGMAVEGKTLYIYGGMGNESGEQSMGRNYYHDLYRVDLATASVTKLWERKTDEHRVAARNMVLSADGNYIYLITYPEYLSETYLQLYRLCVADGKMEAVGDSIPMISDEIATNANLYYNKERNEFYCTVQEFTKEGEVGVRVYSLSAPPVSKAQMEAYKTVAPRLSYGVGIALGLLVAVGGGLWWYGKRRKKKPEAVPAEAATPVAEEPVKESLPAGQPVALPNKNAIYLFGSFTVFDRKGTDISHLFSTRIRQIFVYILLHSVRNGVLSGSLNEIFWTDKPEDKVKNLKGVTINQLRKILSDIEGIELVYEKGYFRIVLQDTCRCDYYTFVQLTSQPEVACSDELLNMLMRGKFLEGETLPALDAFKSSVEEFLNSYLPLEIERQFRQHHHERVVRLCNIYQEIDPLNEKALAYAVYTLNQTGNSQEAILRYSAFIKEYKRLMNEDSPLSYRQLTEAVPTD